MENEHPRISPSDKLLKSSNKTSVLVPEVRVVVDKMYNPEFDKVEIDATTQKYACLTKGELQSYADDPAWKRLRLILFVLLWAIWLTMFVGASVIVVFSPKCPAKPTRLWWQKQVNYQIWTRSFQDSDKDGVGDLQGIIRRIPDLLRLGVQSLWLVPLLKTSSFNSYDVTNFTQVDPRLGTMADFDELVKKLHDRGLFLIMDYPASLTSFEHPWFADSASRKIPFNNFYVWRKDVPSSPTNIWALDDVRNEFYMHYPNRKDWPLLNWSDPSMRRAMLLALRFWLDHGVDGFCLSLFKYLSLDDEGQTDWDAIHGHLTEIAGAVQQYKNVTGHKEIILFTALPGETDIEELKASLVREGSLTYVINTELTTVDALCNARCVRGHLSSVKEFHDRFNETWPMWQLGDPYISRVASRAGGAERSELLMFLLMMLPGSVTTFYGDELGLQDADTNTIPADVVKLNKNAPFRVAMQWNDLDNGGFSEARELGVPFGNLSVPHFLAQYEDMYSPLQTFKRMASRRKTDDAFLFGTLQLGPADDDVLVLARNSITNTANYIAVFNFGSEEHVVNLADKKYGIEASIFNVAWMTSNLGHRKEYEWREEITTEKLKLNANEAILLRCI